MMMRLLILLATGTSLLATASLATSPSAWPPFQPVRRPPVPMRREASMIINPIDRFVTVQLASRGKKLEAATRPEVLVRRVYLDLIGLPPTPSEVRAFLADARRDAYDRLVDRLLASPQYGERWARHWMDVWRYSDWDGYGAEVRNSQPHIWRWRDWIVESLNADQGYDRMVQEMLAGDELAPGDPAVLPATGFLARNWYRFNREVTLNNLVEHSSKAFLGITMNCARCHDHMYDRISMDEYYAFRAFFATHDVRIDRVPGQPDVKQDGIARAFDGKPNEPTFVFVRGDERHPEKSKPCSPAVPALLGGPLVNVESVVLPLTEHTPDRRDFVIRETVADSEAALRTARADLTALTNSLLHQTPAREANRQRAAQKLSVAEAKHAALLAVLAAERGGEPEALRAAALQRTANHLAAQLELALARETDLLRQQTPTTDQRLRALTEKKLADAERAFAEAERDLNAPPTSKYKPRVTATYPTSSSGRRLALARWITDRSNPLTARVAVNHIWLRHLGAALVPSVFDFGRNGKQPADPALLDWLAAELMDHGWSMKHLHRLIVTSATYRQASASEASPAPEELPFRFQARRVEAEVVRDCVLRSAGELDLRMGGREFDPAEAEESKRRSLYFRHSMEKNARFLTAFDQANVNECYERTESIMPQQALALANSPLVLAAARRLAARLTAMDGDFVGLAFEQMLGRPPTGPERTECGRFLSEQESRLRNETQLTAFPTGVRPSVPPSRDAAQRARESLVLVLLNHHEFVTLR